MATSKFNMIRLEERIAPSSAPAQIHSVDLTDPGVNGAEHALKGLANNHASDSSVVTRHGG